MTNIQYPDEAIVLALTVIKEGGSVRDACAAVALQYDKRPDLHTVRRWCQRSEEAFAALRPEKKREWETLSGQVFVAWAHRALEAAEAKDEEGNYVVKHSQVMVPYGIAKDGLRVVIDTITGRVGNQLNVQFNMVSQDGTPIKEGEAGIEGEVLKE